MIKGLKLYRICSNNTPFSNVSLIVSSLESKPSILTSVLMHRQVSEEHINIFNKSIRSRRQANTMHNVINHGNRHSVHSARLSKVTMRQWSSIESVMVSFTFFVRRLEDEDLSGGRHLWVSVERQIAALEMLVIALRLLTATPTQDSIALNIDFVGLRVFEHFADHCFGQMRTVVSEGWHNVVSGRTPELID